MLSASKDDPAVFVQNLVCLPLPVVVGNGLGTDELIISVPYEVWSLNPRSGKLKWFAETDVDTNS